MGPPGGNLNRYMKLAFFHLPLLARLLYYDLTRFVGEVNRLYSVTCFSSPPPGSVFYDLPDSLGDGFLFALVC